MNEKLITFIENSFLKDLFSNTEITDVSYNGVNVFYQHNKLGRMKADFKVSQSEVIDFIRQIANFAERQFSFATPILDVSIGRYRINAVHPSIVRVGDDKACSFAIRVGSTESRIKNDKDFISEDALMFLDKALEEGESLVISGPTGSGKTELQKFLLTRLRKNSRIIVIDNIQELDNVRINDDLDITSWQISPSNPSGSALELIRNALRSNPDWLVVAEARGKEMNDVLNSVMTGHPIITTLHAKKIETIPHRICRMVEMANTNQKREDILEDIKEHIRIYVQLNRKINKDGSVKRYVESIGEMQEDGKMKIVFRREKL